MAGDELQPTGHLPPPLQRCAAHVHYRRVLP